MSKIDGYYRSAITYTQSPPTTETVSSNFNYTIADNLYGNTVLLYTGLIPTSNPLTAGADEDKYTAPNGVEIIEKVAVQPLTAVEDSAFGFTDPRLTYLIPGSAYNVTVWSKDSNGDYTVPVPPRYYNIFFYPSTGTYVVYFTDTSYEPMYRTADGLTALQYPPAITCYRYCGPVGIENLTDADDKVRVSSNDTTAGYLNGKLVAGTNVTFTENNNGANETLTISAASGPPVIYQKIPDSPNWTNNTTTFQTITDLTVTGLEANYLYRLSFMCEVNPAGWNTLDHNFKFRILTAAGAVSESGNSSDMWYTILGGCVTQGPGFGIGTDIFWPVWYTLLQTNGWKVSETASIGDSGKIYMQLLYKTGSTADSRSVRIDAALGQDDGGGTLTVYGGSAAIVIEPIKSLV